MTKRLHTDCTYKRPYNDDCNLNGEKPYDRVVCEATTLVLNTFNDRYNCRHGGNKHAVIFHTIKTSLLNLLLYISMASILLGLCGSQRHSKQL